MVKLKKPGDDFDQGEQMGAAESRIKRTEEMRSLETSLLFPKRIPSAKPSWLSLASTVLAIILPSRYAIHTFNNSSCNPGLHPCLFLIPTINNLIVIHGNLQAQHDNFSWKAPSWRVTKGQKRESEFLLLSVPMSVYSSLYSLFTMGCFNWGCVYDLWVIISSCQEI